MDSIFWGVVLRLAQVIIFSAPWVAAGFVIAGVFRVMIGPSRTRAMFGGSGWAGLLAGWVWGMLLPVCSLGVIPVVLELRKSGVRGGTLIAFALTAPLFNPLSLLYGLTLSDPLAIIAFAGCSLLIVGLVGLLWDWIFPDTSPPPEASEPEVAFGIKRMIAVFRASTEMIYGPATLLILVGIIGSVAVSIVIPHGALSTMLERENILAPAMVAGIATPVYSTPLLAMSQIGSMFQHGNSIGAAFTLLIFGAGINLGLLALFIRVYGVRQLGVFLLLLAVTGIGLAYTISEPLFPEGIEVAGHTHAFDVYTRPYMTGTPDLPRKTWEKIVEHWGNHEFGGVPILAGMIVLGGVFLVLDRITGLRNWLRAPSGRHRVDRVLPTGVVAASAIIGLVALSIVGCYVYYPPKAQTLSEMRAFNAEVALSAKTGNWDGALKWIAFQEDLARRLEIGTFIRSGELGEYHRTKARIFRENLELLRHALEDRNQAEADRLAMQTDQAFRRMSRAFLRDGN